MVNMLREIPDPPGIRTARTLPAAWYADAAHHSVELDRVFRGGWACAGVVDELEETVLTREQNAFKRTAARTWVDLVYRGLFFEPLKYDIEALLESSQRFITGEVTIETSGGQLLPVAVESKHMLKNPKAVYAQSADWTAAHAEGFIQLFGQSTTLSSRVNPRS